MRRIDDEDTARETGPARSHETASSRQGVFTERFVRFGTAAPFLATKGTRARTKYAQRDHEGSYCLRYAVILITIIHKVNNTQSCFKSVRYS